MAKDAHVSKAPDPIFTFVGGPCCPRPDFVFDFWIMIAFETVIHVYVIKFAVLNGT
jgi:hypothetical protein